MTTKNLHKTPYVKFTYSQNFKYPKFQDNNPAITTTTDKWIEFDYENMPAG